MAENQDERIPTGTRSVLAPIPLLILIGLLIFFSYDYGETARRLPLIIATATLALLILDFLSRPPGKVGRIIRLSLGAGFQDPELKRDPQWRSEIVQVIWVAFCVISILLVGILPTIPIFIFLYMVTNGKQTVVSGLTVSAITLLLVAIVFELLLEYELYRGLLFDRDGF
jgi:formate hydrogenlyase subunit 3/multisubunit Na+/H+ antiporter MnhD subunit